MAAFISTASTLPPALSGDWRELDGRAGRLGYYVAGSGPPLLLIHSINAAGSSYEVRPDLPACDCLSRRVWAVRPARLRYIRPISCSPVTTSVLYVAAINDMLDAIAAEAGSVAG